MKTKQKQKRREVPAHCEKCAKKFYSLTTNKDGRIICPSCDKDFNPKY